MIDHQVHDQQCSDTCIKNDAKQQLLQSNKWITSQTMTSSQAKLYREKP